VLVSVIVMTTIVAYIILNNIELDFVAGLYVEKTCFRMHYRIERMRANERPVHVIAKKLTKYRN